LKRNTEAANRNNWNNNNNSCNSFTGKSW